MLQVIGRVSIERKCYKYNRNVLYIKCKCYNITFTITFNIIIYINKVKVVMYVRQI